MSTLTILTGFYEVELSLNRTWDPALEDTESAMYQELSAEVCGNVEEALEDTNLTQCVVLSFR